eukprot:TRINITY_DN3714_c0_g3_i2.p1 TRINITY_DN3714_c0_g3~~TRINITY_DN3714_c0_g3_i2.p1  ORF type:complete len:747 (-),score=99.69 TRINITY_DN3714_c0_g3_i2:376-2616(-)
MLTSAVSNIVCLAALLCICILASSIRLFSIIKYESVIHEFDPYFNYRVTRYLTNSDFYEVWNWFDDRTWYPLGRVIGGTMYPGLIFTAGLMHKILQTLNIPIDVQEVCVLTAPLFAAFCAVATFLFVREIKGAGAGLTAAAFVSIVPSYISRSVAGSFDLEGVAIFALVFVFYCYVKTLNTGSLFWATALCGAYYYMVMSWGGYSFIINLLPIHCLVQIFTRRLTARLYIAYAPLIVIGTMMAASIPVIGFNAVLMSEHFGSFLALAVLHVALFIQFIQDVLPRKTFVAAAMLLLAAGVVVLGLVLITVIGYVLTSPTFGWTGRSLSLLDPTYASKYIPIIASVSEHQPPAWTSYFNDLHMLALLMPVGFVFAFRPLTDASLFLILYGITAVYFSGVMVRLMLVLAPAACCLGGIAGSEVLKVICSALKVPESAQAQEEQQTSSGAKSSKVGRQKSKKGSGGGSSASDDPLVSGPGVLPRDAALVGLGLAAMMMIFYTFHSVYVSASHYSAPSIVLQSRRHDGGLHVFDDFREGYAWLRHNTDPEAKVASWWDYGYQTTAMANRTVLVDNNTWNNTHIATVGRAMSSPEKKAWKIYRYLDVDYVFVIFGGLIGYPSDDINKFLWMVRIGGGVFPEIKEKDYLGKHGYRVDDSAGEALINSLMYRLSYYRFAEATMTAGGEAGMDRVRGTRIGKQDIKLRYFEEVFTSEHWMIRIYKVKDDPIREKGLKNAKKLKKGSKRDGAVKRF